jgi:sugar phosphate isomerase/epimerase
MTHYRIGVVGLGQRIAHVLAAMQEVGWSLDVVAHVEIAEKETRSYPGVHGDDFRPFFKVLRAAGCSGAISIEGKGEPAQVAPAFAEIITQAAEA